MLVNFKDYNKKKKELKEYKKLICKTIDDFILYDELFRKDRILTNSQFTHPIHSYKSSFDFYYDKNQKFTIQFFYDSGNENVRQFDTSFLFDEEMRLIEFMKDPELYKNTNKYNL